MILKKEILKFILAGTFSLALLFPTAVKFFHIFENHHHEVCTDYSVHIHKKQLDCSVFDFHFSIFSFETQNLPEYSSLNSSHQTETLYVFPELAIDETHYFLRGPPLSS